MKFISMPDDDAYEAADQLKDRKRSDDQFSTTFEGVHPTHGRIRIILPLIGTPLVFGEHGSDPVNMAPDAFRPSPTVMQV